MFHHSIARNRYYFEVHTFIGQQIHKMSVEDWKCYMHNHGHHGEADTSISDIAKMKKKYDIAIQDHI